MTHALVDLVKNIKIVVVKDYKMVDIEYIKTEIEKAKVDFEEIGESL